MYISPRKMVSHCILWFSDFKFQVNFKCKTQCKVKCHWLFSSWLLTANNPRKRQYTPPQLGCNINTACTRSTVGSYVFTGVCLSYFQGVPQPVEGGGYPIPGPGSRGTPSQVCRWRVPHPRSRWGVPPIQTWDGVPPIQDWMGSPPLVRRQSSKTSTCYTAGGTPLAFTQEDFLVLIPI